MRLTSGRALQNDFAVANIFQNAGVGGGLATFVVMLWKAVDGDGNAAAWQADPLFWNWDYSAGDDQREDTTAAKLGQDAAQFAMPDQWFTADQRHVKGAMALHQIHNTRNQCVASKIGKLAQRAFAAEV
jgi:hypothetical protein